MLKITDNTFLVEFKARTTTTQCAIEVEKCFRNFQRALELAGEVVRVIDALPSEIEGLVSVSSICSGALELICAKAKDSPTLKVLIIPLKLGIEDNCLTDWEIKKTTNDCGVYFRVEHVPTRIHYTLSQPDGGAELAKFLIVTKIEFLKRRGELEVFKPKPKQKRCPRCHFPEPDPRVKRPWPWKPHLVLL